MTENVTAASSNPTYFGPDHPWRNGSRIHVPLPAQYIPYPPSTAPLAPEAEVKAIDWLTRHGLCKTKETRHSTISTSSADFTSRVCDETVWSEEFQTIVDSVYFWFCVDDVIDGVLTPDEPVNRSSLLRYGHAILDVIEKDDSAFSSEVGFVAGAAADLGRRIRNLGSYAYFVRYIRDMRQYITGCYYQLADPDGKEPIGHDKLVALSTAFSGYGVFSSLYPYLSPDPVPLELLDSREIIELTRLMATICELQNHICSLGKDLWLGAHHVNQNIASSLNVVAHLSLTRKIPLDEALCQVARLSDTLIVRFERTYNVIYPHMPAGLRHYMRNVRKAIRGNFDYHLTTARYTNPDGRHPDAVVLIPNVIHTHAPSGEQPPLPSTAHWWHL